MTLRRRKAPDCPKLSQSEWDFSDCPKDLIWECWCHEFGRQNAEVIQGFEQEWAAGRFETPGVVHVASQKAGNLLVFRLAEGFPRLPFLESKFSALRAPRRMRNLNPDNPLLAVARMALDGVMSHAPGEKQMPGVGYVRLDFRHSKTTLKKAVSRWIDLNWVKQMTPITKLGRPNSARLMDDLNALGAWRLLQHYNANQAAELTQKYPRMGGSEEPLFENPPEWTKARQRAAKRISEIRNWFDPTTS